MSELSRSRPLPFFQAQRNFIKIKIHKTNQFGKWLVVRNLLKESGDIIQIFNKGGKF